jgi:D-beta-D-heptose 7-phosphate kinase/D-beta-D-heptose 1-phosphate adenosyltransferase
MAQAILEKVPAIAGVIVTRSGDGMTLAVRGEVPLHLPVKAKSVYDVSGAGDTVIATLSLALASGATHCRAAHLANLAGGIVVGKLGTAEVRADELRAEVQAETLGAIALKNASTMQAAAKVADWKSQGLKVGFTNGCFDLIHPGHISLLAQARKACDRLVVGLNSDASVKRLKGEERPLQNENARSTVLDAMSVVDLVVIFDEDTPLELIRLLQPDVLVKGADYRLEQVVGADIVQRHGGRVVLAELVVGQSTTGIVSRMGK